MVDHVSDEADFLPADTHEIFLQIDSMILMGMVKIPQSSQNSNFAVSLQYLKKEVRDEVDFLHADKHQSFPQVDFVGDKSFRQGNTVIVDEHDQAISKYPK